jgi:hypothetical protein
MAGGAAAIASPAAPQGKVDAAGSWGVPETPRSFLVKLALWNVATGECEQTFAGHSRAVMSAGFSPDGTKVVSTSSDETLRLWRVV